ncbi:MAG: hypothetical protein JO193_09660 [Candidatus Eremiobacteraeota bacterium]|nr:hypothetical protein [Candidatus Eremiobacteraeota bacterium]
MDRREVTFLVRMWLQQENSGTDHWRGSVQEVASGKRRFVTGTPDVADFIATHLQSKRHEEADKR